MNMKKCILLISLLCALMSISASDNLLVRLCGNENLARADNWYRLCSYAKVEEDDNNIVVKVFDKEISGDSLFLVELYSTGPHKSPLVSFWAFRIESDSILVIGSDSSSLGKIQFEDMSCDYKLYDIIKQRDFELLEKWNRKIWETDTETPSSKYFVTMFYKSGHSVCLRKWEFFIGSLRRRLMRDYLLDRKNKGLDYYYPYFDDLMKDD